MRHRRLARSQSRADCSSERYLQCDVRREFSWCVNGMTDNIQCASIETNRAYATVANCHSAGSTIRSYLPNKTGTTLPSLRQTKNNDRLIERHCLIPH